MIGAFTITVLASWPPGMQRSKCLRLFLLIWKLACLLMMARELGVGASRATSPTSDIYCGGTVFTTLLFCCGSMAGSSSRASVAVPEI